MVSTVLNSDDIFSFKVVASPQDVPPTPTCTATDTFDQYCHPDGGSFKLKSACFPHMHVLDMRWNTTKDLELHDESPSDSIRINFKLDGYLHTRFSGLKHALDMSPQKHNLIYVPEGKDINSVKGNQLIAMLHINLDKNFFASAIGHDDAWSERLLTDLAHQRPFSAATAPLPITLPMLHLIEGIRNCNATGPMRNLLIQSRVLELVALEIDQLKTSPAHDDTIRPDEIEKLNRLKAYLDANFLSDMSLAQLSRHCLLNEFKVKKGFKQLFDTTVFNYVRKLRMDYAGQLLRHCTLTVDEVADRLGYEHSQHFSIAFKKYTGLTPSQYQHGKHRTLANSFPTVFA
ncbi:AraC family transcriptional regulator [Spirosoma sp. RP8]|uniref:AraC family transcriptional regulator n=1 Tax=Spirosoma liriopis TaxID=2937440 RepID=A0ABT0HND6_9BACT|nr:AraC family transcriptional regulator [Spirosoma liriopis]MCK8493682.1 AraC family transcriptional regulator [Spirosoma liriopis]